MGILRLLLASLVLASHSQVVPVYAGIVAVECFFVISGFYMQMILRETYYPGHAQNGQGLAWWQKFYISRCLRIFVPYWLVLLLVAVVTRIASHDATLPYILTHLSDQEAWVGFFSNLFILGTEHIKLWRTAEGCSTAYWDQLLIPQVWSVGIELIFYLCAPVILLCRTRLLAAITALSLCGKIILLYVHYRESFTFECGDGLLNGIFPLEIGIFGIGALGYRLYKSYLMEKRFLQSARFFAGSIAGMCIVTVLMACGLRYANNPFDEVFIFYGYVLFTMLLVPFLFAASRTRVWDRAMGELSYVFYLSHYCIMQYFPEPVHLSHSVRFLVLEIMTLLCAYIINRYIETPLDKIRHAYFA